MTLRDSAGRAWHHPDAARLRAWVARRNLLLATIAAARRRP